MNNEVYIVGAGCSRITRGVRRSAREIVWEAVSACLDFANLEVGAIDGIVNIPSPPNAHGHVGHDRLETHQIRQLLGIDNLAVSIDLASPHMLLDAVALAGEAVRNRACTTALVVRAMQEPTRPNVRADVVPLPQGDSRYSAPYGVGLTGPVRHAVLLSRLMAERDWTRSDLFEVVRLARTHARSNPDAYWHDSEVPTVEEYLAAESPFLPLSILDCDIPITGASAFIVSGQKQIGEPSSAARIAATSDSAFVRPADLLGRADCADDIQFAQIYDGFSYLVPLWLEFTGRCELGAAGNSLRAGLGSSESELPINTFGGSLGEGRLHGGGHLREAVIQIAGRAGDRQLPLAERGLVTCGLPGRGSSLLLERVS